jgi:non-ribosomal peptide synthetase component F
MPERSAPIPGDSGPQPQGLPDRHIGPSNPFAVFPPEAIEQAIPVRFEQQVSQYPDRLAVKTARHALTYEALHGLANQVARAILARRGRGEEPVAALFGPEAPLITATLGVLQAGKIYVPLDPTFPTARLTSMLADSQACVLVTNTDHLPLAQVLAPPGCQVLNVDDGVSLPSTENPNLPLTPDTLACIYYTSGSTGHPKGVVHSHRTVLHAIANYTNSMHICADDRLTLLYSCSAIGAMKDTFKALLNGAALYPFDVQEAGLERLAHWLMQEEITIYHSVTTLFRHLVSALTGVEHLPRLRLVQVGGEATTKRDVELFKQACPADCFLYVSLAATETGGSIRKCFLHRETQLSGSVAPPGYAVQGMEVLLLDGVPPADTRGPWSGVPAC